MRRLRSALLLAVPVVLVAAAFTGLRVDRAAQEDAFFHWVTNGSLQPPRVGPAFLALGGGDRVKAVQAWGREAKAYAASQAFRDRYAAWRKEELGGVDAPRTAVQMKEELNTAQAEQREALKQMEAQIPTMPKEMQAQMRETLAQMKRDMTSMPRISDADLEASAAQEAQRSKAETARREAAVPADPKVKLREALKGFLAATDGVDYGAAIQVQNGRRVFANRALEAKPGPWKMAFRAGKEPAEAARAFARNWLAELK